MYDSLDVAAYVAQQCVLNGYAYNNTKIQKLLYCCYGVFLAAFDERLCKEHPKAWQYGPVFPRVFRAILSGKELAQHSYLVRNDLEGKKKDLLDKTVRIFGKHNASTLSAWSHKQGSPWDIVVNSMGQPNGIIPDDLIIDYFKTHVLEASDYA